MYYRQQKNLKKTKQAGERRKGLGFGLPLFLKKHEKYIMHMRCSRYHLFVPLSRSRDDVLLKRISERPPGRQRLACIDIIAVVFDW